MSFLLANTARINQVIENKIVIYFVSHQFPKILKSKDFFSMTDWIQLHEVNLIKYGYFFIFP